MLGRVGRAWPCFKIDEKASQGMADDDKRSRAVLRVRSAELTAEAIGAALGLRPTASLQAGVPLGRRAGSPLRGDHVFILDSGLSEREPLERHISELLSLIEPVQGRLSMLRGAAEADLFCFFSSENGQGGFVLPPEVMGRLSSLGLELIVDLYPPSQSFAVTD